MKIGGGEIKKGGRPSARERRNRCWRVIISRFSRCAKIIWRYSDCSEFPYHSFSATDEAALILVRFYIRHLPPVRLDWLANRSKSQILRDSNYSFAPDWYPCQYYRGTYLAACPVSNRKLCFAVLFRKNPRWPGRLRRAA